jgi:hypothetical protein
MPLTVEEYENAMLLLETVMTSIDAIDLDLGLNEDADVDLLDILDEDLQRFNEDDLIHSSPEGFIDYFSYINIMRNQKAGRLSEDKFEEWVDKWAPRGNSRDAPICFIYRCSNWIWGCDYTNGECRAVEEHFRKCKISYLNPVKLANILCRKPNCEKGFRTVATQKSYEREHNFEHRQCNDCNDGKWYATLC